MESQTEILHQLQSFLKKYPSETSILLPFVQFVQAYDGDQLFTRKNFNGHITASAFIINSKTQRMLLLKHKALNRWLQPGGHVDVTDTSLMAATLREAQEETGISPKNLHPLFNTIFDFDSHIIPENTRKQEPSHYHHDVRFLFDCSVADVVTIAEDESTDSNWVAFNDLEDNPDFSSVVQKIRNSLQERVLDKELVAGK